MLRRFARRDAGADRLVDGRERLGVETATELRGSEFGAGIDRLGRRSRYTPSAEHIAKMVDASTRRTQRLYTLGGVTKSTKEWASELKIPISTFRHRVTYWPEANVLSGESPFELNKGVGGRRR
jgi:hypothetical protein